MTNIDTENEDFDVFDLMTNKKNFVTNEIIYDMTFAELTEITKVAEKGIYEDEFGKTFSIELDDRYMIMHTPRDFKPEKKYKLLIFFHGLGDHPWSVGISETNWRKLSNIYQFIIAYAAGTACNLVYDRRCGFDIKYPNDDLHYMEKIIKTVTERYHVDGIFYIGFSNGAILSSIVAQKYGGSVFEKMVNIMGGFGHQFVLDLDFHITNPLPILFITGTHDDYKSSCEYAFYFFKNRGYDVKMKTLDGVSHVYPIWLEEYILSFLGLGPTPHPGA